MKSNGHRMEPVGQGGLEQASTLDGLLAGLSHGERVERLGALLKECAKLPQARPEPPSEPVSDGAAPGHPGAARPEPPSEPVSDGAARGRAAQARPESPSATESNGEGRDGKSGRFGLGNRFGRGNPHARRQAALCAVLTDAVDEQRLRKVAATLADRAEGGDLEAIKLLFAYLLGKPGPAPNPDRLDIEEWKLLDAEPTIYEFFRAVFDNVSAAYACEYLKKRQEEKRQEAKLLEPPTSAGAAEIMQARGQRSGRKRKPSAALPG
jgi:hypothetical protein